MSSLKIHIIKKIRYKDRFDSLVNIQLLEDMIWSYIYIYTDDVTIHVF